MKPTFDESAHVDMSAYEDIDPDIAPSDEQLDMVGDLLRTDVTPSEGAQWDAFVGSVLESSDLSDSSFDITDAAADGFDDADVTGAETVEEPSDPDEVDVEAGLGSTDTSDDAALVDDAEADDELSDSLEEYSGDEYFDDELPTDDDLFPDGGTDLTGHDL